MSSGVLPPQTLPAQITNKGFGIRAVSYVIDQVIYIAVNGILGIALGVVLGIYLVLVGLEMPAEFGTATWIDYTVAFVMFNVYFILFEWLYGATPAKLILGMRVIRDDGEPCGLWAAVLRMLSRFFEGLFFGLPAYFKMRKPPYRRGGDEWAKTVVVGAHDPSIRARRPW